MESNAPRHGPWSGVEFDGTLQRPVCHNSSELFVQVEFLISLNTKFRQSSPILLGSLLVIVKRFRHELLLILLLLDLHLIVPILHLLRLRRIHSLLPQGLGITCVSTPGILGGSHLGLIHRLGQAARLEIGLVETRASISRDSHLTISSVELVKVYEIVKVTGSSAVHLTFVHDVGFARIGDGIGGGIFLVELAGKIVKISLEGSDRFTSSGN
mmetsp:Transcript_5870/g.8611  ORF Transcript_5870/g.8611 Transcript_5870/m.8611 type:complete len:213 (-) Transcript_5870:65-703(-)